MGRAGYLIKGNMGSLEETHFSLTLSFRGKFSLESLEKVTDRQMLPTHLAHIC